MPKAGYESVTLSEEVLEDIDELVDKENKALKSRSKVVSVAVKRFKDDIRS